MTTDAQIEAAAKALYEFAPQYLTDEDKGVLTGPKPWEWLGEEFREYYRAQVRVVLAAADALTEQPEVEWGFAHSQGTNAARNKADALAGVEAQQRQDEHRQRAARGKAHLVRRVPAGPWLQVGEGE